MIEIKMVRHEVTNIRNLYYPESFHEPYPGWSAGFRAYADQLIDYMLLKMGDCTVTVTMEIEEKE